MKILQFAFDGGACNPYLPFHHDRDAVVYTGTHDNDTSLGWYLSLDPAGQRYVDEFLGHSAEPMPWPLVRAALSSRATLAVLPMQDLLELDGVHRMNVPGTAAGNWTWRFAWDMVPEGLSQKVRRMVEIYGR
jgi:4-alpha-glucanotransferase